MIGRCTFAALLLAAPADASTVRIWTGAGPNACHGYCSLEWAADQLSPERRAELDAAMLEQPEPAPILVHHGDQFDWMSYQRGGVPYTQGATLAELEHGSKRAWGWRLDGWSFVQIEACANWAVLLDGPGPLVGKWSTPSYPVVEPEPWWTVPPVVYYRPYDPIVRVVPPEPPHEPPVAPIPVPAGAGLLLAGLGLLWGWRRA